MWYRFEAWNQQTLYGWTRDPKVMERVLDGLNSGRDVNLYSATALSDNDAENDAEVRGEDASPLSEGDGFVCDDDTMVSDFDDL